MGRPISKTTKFILSLPRDLPAKDVLAKAKASGHKTSESNVHRVRRLHGRGKAAKKTNAVAAIAPKAAGSSAKGLKKSEFVRGLAASTPAKDVVAQAKAAGLKLDLQYVYKVRSRPKPHWTTVAVARPAAATFARAKSGVSDASAEDLLRAVAAELGLGRAVEILQNQRAQVRAVLGG